MNEVNETPDEEDKVPPPVLRPRPVSPSNEQILDISPIHPTEGIASGHPTYDQSNPVVPSPPPVRRNVTDSVRPGVPRLDADTAVRTDPPVRRSTRVKVQRNVFQAKLSGKAHE